MNPNFEILKDRMKDFISKHVVERVDTTKTSIRRALKMSQEESNKDREVYSTVDSSSSSSSRNNLRDRMREFYRLHNPVKVAQVDALAAKHESKPDALMRALHRKYRPENAGRNVREEKGNSIIDKEELVDGRGKAPRFVEMMQGAKMRVQFKVDETLRKLHKLERSSEIARRRLGILDARWEHFQNEIADLQNFETRAKRLHRSLEDTRRSAGVLEGRLNALFRGEVGGK